MMLEPTHLALRLARSTLQRGTTFMSVPVYVMAGGPLFTHITVMARP